MIYIGFIFITIGVAFITSGIIGLFRFRNFYTKFHAASVVECCGIPFCLIGLSCIQTDWNSAFKLIVMVILLLVLNPISTHALAKASLTLKKVKNKEVK